MMSMEHLPFDLNETMHKAKIIIDPSGLSAQQYAKKVLSHVMDPEIPVLSLYDLGIIRRVKADNFETIYVDITPTYSGCPATVAIQFSIEVALLDAGFSDVYIQNILSPAWTTDWISNQGRQKLKQYGIAPPKRGANKNKGALFHQDIVCCPQCDSDDTKQVSQFGSTACKALYKCNTCMESFEYFKCI